MAPLASADEPPDLLTDSFQISLGTFGINSQPSVELNGRTGGGGKVDFDKALGGGDAFRARLDVQWRFAERHKSRFAAFGLSQSRDRVLDRDIEWGDEVYPTDAEVEFDSSFWVLQGIYDYSFLRSDDYELGASIGLRGQAALPYNLWVEASAQYFALSIDEYDGNLQDYRLFVTWQPMRWVASASATNASRST